jgi:hypothetical protein
MGVLIKSHSYDWKTTCFVVFVNQYFKLITIIQNMGILIKSHSSELMIGKQNILHMLAHHIQLDFSYINTFLN